MADEKKTKKPKAPKAQPKPKPTRPATKYTTVCRACAKGTEAQRKASVSEVLQDAMGDATLLCKQHGPKPVHRTIVKSQQVRVPL